MSYCVHCGVELAESEARCSLCNTKVVDPAAPRQGTGKTPYPPYETISPERVSKKSVLMVLTLIFLVPLCLAIVCDTSINGRISWSGFVIGGLFVLYVAFFVPILLAGRWLKNLSILCISANTAAILCYLFYIEQAAGGTWFAIFAVPVVLLAAFSIIIAILLRKYAGATRLMVFAVVLAELGIFCLVLELMLNRAFGLRDHLVWSAYPLVTCLILGAIVAVIDRTPVLKEKMGRKFFI